MKLIAKYMGQILLLSLGYIIIGLISGKLSSSILFAFLTISTVLVNEPPCNVITPAAKSPSSSCGINSPPKLLNKKRLNKNNRIADNDTSNLCFNENVITGLKAL